MLAEKWLIYGGDGQPVALIEQRGGTRVVKIELVVEVHAVGGNVPGQSIRSLQSNPLPETALELREEGVVVVDLVGVWDVFSML